MQRKRMCGWHDGALNRVDTCACLSDLSTLSLWSNLKVSLSHSILTVFPLKFLAFYACICQVAAVLTLDGDIHRKHVKGNSG